MKVIIRTLGCRLNQQESEAVAAAFNNSGIHTTNNEDEADLAVVNTCTVTAKADRKNRHAINSLAKKGIPVLVTGCYAAVDKEEIERNREKIMVIPRGKKAFLLDLPFLIPPENVVTPSREDFFSFLKVALNSFPEKCGDFDFFCEEFTNHTRGFLKIQDGCNNGCTYCRTVLARGKSRSLDPQIALERVRLLEKRGISEVMLTAVNLAQYENAGFVFSDLLQYLLEGSEKINFRISSFHPEKIDDRFLKVAENPRVMPHFHLSVQSGSDRILKRMARPYDRKRVEKAVSELRTVKDNPFVACDIIVGFPGEYEDDFSQTLSLCSECDFAWVHQFAFSPRPGTKAYEMTDLPTEETVKKRQFRLLTEAMERKSRYCKSQVGKILATVIEKNRPDGRGVTENFLHIRVAKSKTEWGGKIVPVRITNACSLTGREGEFEAEGIAEFS